MFLFIGEYQNNSWSSSKIWKKSIQWISDIFFDRLIEIWTISIRNK